MAANYTAIVESVPEIEVELGKRIPNGWRAFPIGPAGSHQNALISFSKDILSIENQGVLRVAVALDEREEKVLQVVIPETQRVLGEIDIRYAHVFQPFGLQLSQEDIQEIGIFGCELKLMQGGKPLWLFCGPTNFNGSTSELLVNISIPSSSEPVSEFFDRLNSLASLQFFGWQEGCVLDGLYDLSKVRPDREIRYTIDLHFAQFFDKQGNLIAEDDFSQPVDGRVYGIEATLPYAVLAQQQPEHPILDMVVDYWRSMQMPDGAIQEASGAYAENMPATSPETTEGTVTTAEGAYTVAYPMAVLSRLPGRSDLAPIAIHQLRIRKARLWKGKDFYLRVREDGTRSFGNWSRGVAWYLLGYARTMIWLDDSQVPDDILDEFKRAAGWVIERQLGNGLWAGFIDSPDVLPDTAGSAGIAAGLALGYTRGYLSSAARDSANMTLNALIPYLTPDGFLRGVSQVNKAGEGLQRSQYRVISQMAMGLMGQLVAALASTSTQPAAGWLDEWS